MNCGANRVLPSSGGSEFYQGYVSYQSDSVRASYNAAFL